MYRARGESEHASKLPLPVIAFDFDPNFLFDSSRKILVKIKKKLF